MSSGSLHPWGRAKPLMGNFFKVMPGSDRLHGSAYAVKAEAGHGKREDVREERPHRLHLVHVDGNGNSILDVKAL